MIELSHIVKEYGSAGHVVRAVDDVTLSIAAGEIFGIIGYSGAGKSTLVRCINLLERPTSGLELVELSDKAAAYPEQLSGGQKQRVAIARALATNPRVLLCDEATSALDPQTTHSILALLKRLNRELGLTVVVITHQMNVVKEICDHVAVMESGRVIESGDVFEVFSTPKHDLTREFIASTSSLTRVHDLVAENSPVVALKPGEVLVRLNYLTRDVNEPIISSISRTFDIDVNIIFADIEVVNGSPIGGTIAKLSGQRAKIDAALDYLPDNENVHVELIADAR